MSWHFSARRAIGQRVAAVAIAAALPVCGVALAQEILPDANRGGGLARPVAVDVPPPLPGVTGARPLNAVLIERLCSKTLRANEEDRLLGEISLAVRATIKYQGGAFSPDLIDDAVQEASEAVGQACPQLAATDDAHRLGAMIDITRDTTARLLADRTRQYSPTQTDSASAADLSEELTTQEIDAWLDGLTPRQRALALFLYASDVTPQEVSQAVGLAPQSLATASGDTKTSLLNFFREEPPGQPAAKPPSPSATRPAMEFREVGESLQNLLQPAAPRPGDPSGAPPAAAVSRIKITGISSDLYSGWSLLATVSDMPADRSLTISQPFLLEPDRPGTRRMIVTDAAELTGPGDALRRFLLKAYAIDGDREGAGLRDTFRLGAPVIDNDEARRTLGNRNLTSIEVARCLWRDYGGDDPGLCR